MNVTIRQLRAFVAVARSHSFTEAAVKLHVTQSALSGLIKELEQTLDVRLFDRSTRQVHLSEVGSEYLPHATRILDDLDQAEGALTELKALRTGVVRVAVSQLMACTLMPQIMGDFKEQHPDIRLVMADASADSIIPNLRNGAVDIAVGWEGDHESDIEAQLLFDSPCMAVVRARHALARRRRVTWEELAAQPLISVAGGFTRMLHADLASPIRIAGFSSRIEVAYMTTALSMVSAGLGITTFFSQPYAEAMIRMYRLKLVPLYEPEVMRRFQLFKRKKRKLSPAAQAFAEFLTLRAAELRT